MAKKKKSAAAKYLAGDTTYQQQLANFNKSKSDFQAQFNRQNSIIKRDFGETGRSMKRQAAQDREDQQNNFAGRGILKSGVFAKALGDYNTEFNAKWKNLLSGQSDKLGDLNMQRTNFLRQLKLESDAARQDALRRRAAKLGI
jgi:hypothetical protein